jgi:hypothetical protein
VVLAKFKEEFSGFIFVSLEPMVRIITQTEIFQAQPLKVYFGKTEKHPQKGKKAIAQKGKS